MTAKITQQLQINIGNMFRFSLWWGRRLRYQHIRKNATYGSSLRASLPVHLYRINKVVTGEEMGLNK